MGTPLIAILFDERLIISRYYILIAQPCITDGGLMNKDDTLDAKGLMCPMPIVKLAKKIKELQVGQVLELIVDDPGAKEDVPAWCSRTGNELLEMKQEGNAYHFFIKKSA